MNGWVHEDGDERCFECYAIEWESDDPKPCSTPTPDPSSPCGWVAADGPCDGDTTWHTCYNGERCAAVLLGKGHPDDVCHPHQPTRCTCGHPIEERA